MEGGEHMLLAQVRTGESPDHIIEVLQRIAAEHEARADVTAAPAEEERIPVIEEELRVGTREVVRGGARVRAHVEEVPFSQDIELIEDQAWIERRPATRRVEDAELQEGQLLRERVIEITQIREEAVVTKEAFVREEVVVKKNVERRTERIEETLRRTEVEEERLGSDGAPAFPALHGDEQRDRAGG
jgi:stress response protein YsnF